ncbi:MAG TPA: universal stress protein [Bacteroidia bacterium]
METILIATDFSDAANNAADYAVGLAKLLSTKLVLVNAYNLPYTTYETGTTGDVIGVLQEASNKGLEHLKDRIQQSNKYRFGITSYSDVGFAEDMIIETAKKVDADLIVMGITGEGGRIKENLIGSTAIKVARNTDVPVFIVPEGVKYHPIRKISFACDLNKTEESDLIYVSRYFGQLFDAELDIVNVEEPMVEFSEEKSKTYAVMNKKLETLSHKSVFITESNTGKALEEYFNEHPTDVVMINPRKHDLFHNLFSRSIAKELAFHCKYPLLCIH